MEIEYTVAKAVSDDYQNLNRMIQGFVVFGSDGAIKVHDIGSRNDSFLLARVVQGDQPSILNIKNK